MGKPDLKLNLITQLHQHCYDGEYEGVDEILSKDPTLVNRPAGQFDFTCAHFAAWNGSEDVMDVLLKYGVDLNALTNQEETAVLFATNHGHEEFVEKVARKMAENGDLQLVNRPSKRKQTPLLRAAQDGRVDLIQFFHDLKITQVDYKDSTGKTALDYAKELEFPESTKILEEW